MYSDNKVLYPKDLPNHHAVGKVFYAWNGQVYYCDSYDPRADFWMTNVVDAADRKAVSPRAINRTFHDAGDTWKPRSQDDVVGRQYHLVDLRVPHAEFTAAIVDEKDCLELDERQILFFWKEDAEKFLRKVKSAAAEYALQQEKRAAAVLG